MPDPTCLTLPSRCDRAAADALLPALREGLDAGDVAIDGRDVGQFGYAMLQLLLSAGRTAAASGRCLTVDASDALRQSLTLADAQALLSDGGAA